MPGKGKGKKKAKAALAKKVMSAEEKFYAEQNAFQGVKSKRSKPQKGTLSRVIGSAIPMLGRAAGAYLGGPEGASAGLAAGKMISAITGFGDYKINSNSISMGNSIPQFRQGGDGMICCHREFIFNLKGSILFRLQSFPINPGMAGPFPFLSQIADRFEEYEMMGLVFEYRPTSGNAVSSTNAALGTVIMATDYDAANPPFLDKQQMESYEFSTATVTSMPVLHPVECARGKNVFNNLYTRTGATPANTDIRLYDMGNFEIATEGMQLDDAVVGEVWVTYDVRFRKPRIGNPFAPIGQGTYLHLETNANGSNATFPLGGTGPFQRYDSNMNRDFWAWDAAFPRRLVLTRKGFYEIVILSSNQTSGTGVHNLTIGTTGSNITVDSTYLSAGTTPAVQIAEYISTQGISCVIGNIVVLASGGPDVMTDNHIEIGYVPGAPFTSNFDLLLTYIGEGVPPPPLLRKTRPFNLYPLNPTNVEVNDVELKRDESWVT